MRLSALLVVLALAACHSTHEQAPTPVSMDNDPDWQTHPVDPNANVPLGVVSDPSTGRLKAGEHDPGAPKPDALGPDGKWHPKSELGKLVDTASPDAASASGSVATVVYVTETGDHGGLRRTGVVIYSSDEDSPLMNQRPTPWRVIKAQTKAEMQKLLTDLKASGLDRLPSESQDVNDPLGDDRQVVIIKDGKRVTYRRSATQKDAGLFKTFRGIEQVLVNDAHDVTPYVQVQGRTDTEHFKPLNADR
ncbi:MAG TPA: hypothetical protein VFF73_41145 [Planctomycetota bacterium]|nr:hypothetical protein [Planctomycetota bacterium]